VDVAIRTPTVHTLGSQVKQRCLWNSTGGPNGNGYEADGTTPVYNRDCVYSGGTTTNTFGLPCGPTGIDPTGRSCREKLRTPKTWEYTFGSEREITQGIGLALDLVYRRFSNQYEASETNRIWNDSGSAILGYRNGRNQTISDMGTPDGAYRYYRGATMALNKREGRFRGYLSYTLSQLRGTVFDGSSNPWGDIPGRNVYLDGPLPDDRLHDVKGSATVSATKWLSLGARYSFSSGFPYNRLYRNDVTGSYENYRAQRGMSAGTNINDPGDDRELRLPVLQELNVQARFSFVPLTGHRLDLYIDLMNVLNTRTVTGYSMNEGQNFGVQSGWQGPMRARLGLNYKF
jgi:hypothetical protein